MDLLSQRYANPYSILDDFIQSGQLGDFTIQALKTIADEKLQEQRWQYYLHRVFDMSYEDFVLLCEKKPEKHEMTDAEKQNVIAKSTELLDGFVR